MNVQCDCGKHRAGRGAGRAEQSGQKTGKAARQRAEGWEKRHGSSGRPGKRHKQEKETGSGGVTEAGGRKQRKTGRRGGRGRSWQRTRAKRRRSAGGANQTAADRMKKQTKRRGEAVTPDFGIRRANTRADTQLPAAHRKPAEGRICPQSRGQGGRKTGFSWGKRPGIQGGQRKKGGPSAARVYAYAARPFPPLPQNGAQAKGIHRARRLLRQRTPDGYRHRGAWSGMQSTGRKRCLFYFASAAREVSPFSAPISSGVCPRPSQPGVQGRLRAAGGMVRWGSFRAAHEEREHTGGERKNGPGLARFTILCYNTKQYREAAEESRVRRQRRAVKPQGALMENAV